VLLEANLNAEDICLVLTPGCDDESIRTSTSLLPPAARDRLSVTIHDPSDQGSLCYLAASKDAKPIYFNRQIYDADVVVPIGILRLEESLGYVGVHGGLFPSFSDEETRRRFRAPSSTDWSVHRRRRREESEEAAWLLGVQFTVQVAPGPGDTLLHVLAGEARAVAAKGHELCEAAWLHRCSRRASLVVATIEGGPEQQTWENFGRALFAASRAVTDGGAIVLCTNLCRPPGSALQRLARPEDADGELHRDLLRERSEDAVSATLLEEAQRRVQVYLLSGLESDVVEELGLGHVANADEVKRLSQQHASCILLGNAHHAMLYADGE
jgi:nickel-dependent lactate racemase